MMSSRLRQGYSGKGGPPTSSAVLVNLGNASLITEASLPTESGARPLRWGNIRWVKN